MRRLCGKAGILHTGSMTLVHQFIQPQAKGVLALPAALRRRLRLDEPGVQIEVTERADGVVELRSTVAVPAAEAWFWEERWQAGERAVDDHVAAGRTTTYQDDDSFVRSLEQ